MTLEARVGQLLVASLDGFEIDQEARRFLESCNIGNIVHFGNNVRDREQAAAFNAALRALIAQCTGVEPLITVDHEGGRVTRFQSGVTHFPPAMAVGATGDVALAEAIGAAMGAELAALGFDMDFAPDLDVNTNPDNPVIGLRAYGDDPGVVAGFGAAMVRGMQGAGLLACGKHFPGHGDTAVDSHFGLPCVERPLDALERAELVPFAAAIEAGVAGIMTSHILYPALEPERVPATMSARILSGLLRQRMGFDGLIITDAMQMKAIAAEYGVERGCVEALRAGVDLVCIGNGGSGHYEIQTACYEAILRAVRDGTLPEARVDEAVERVLRAKARRTPVAPDWGRNEALAQRVAEASITHVAGPVRRPEGKSYCAAGMPEAIVRRGVNEADWVRESFLAHAADLLDAEAIGLGVCEADGFPDDADALVLWMQRGDEAEIRCLRAALRQGLRTTVVLTGLPYTAKALPHGCGVLCCYGTTEVSIQAACRVLRGEYKPTGRLPVRLR